MKSDLSSHSIIQEVMLRPVGTGEAQGCHQLSRRRVCVQSALLPCQTEAFFLSLVGGPQAPPSALSPLINSRSKCHPCQTQCNNMAQDCSSTITLKSTPAPWRRSSHSAELMPALDSQVPTSLPSSPLPLLNFPFILSS